MPAHLRERAGNSRNQPVPSCVLILSNVQKQTYLHVAVCSGFNLLSESMSWMFHQKPLPSVTQLSEKKHPIIRSRHSESKDYFFSERVLSVFHFYRVGVLEDTFTCLGVLCAIVFFPIGILFCLALRQRRCPNCGAAFG
uniref:Membrane protein BRI3 n=1 Tax=Athene cunicularia TaxID=194338 RepID=A0A663NB57_ATHCN